MPEVREKMIAQGQTPVGNTPEEFTANVRADLPKWEALIKASGATHRIMQTDYVQRFLFENLDVRGRLVCLTGAWRKMTDGRGYPPRDRRTARPFDRARPRCSARTRRTPGASRCRCRARAR